MVYSIISALSIFYLIAANCFQHDLLAKQLKTWIVENRHMQHIIACIMLFVIVLLLTKMSIEKSILYSVFGYMLFILTTKLDIQFNVIVFALMFLGFLYENNISRKEEQLEKDPTITQEVRQNLITKYMSNQFLVVIGTVILTSVGTYLYLNRKLIQFGGKFSYTQFLLY
jgi:hypothetical protein